MKKQNINVRVQLNYLRVLKVGNVVTFLLSKEQHTVVNSGQSRPREKGDHVVCCISTVDYLRISSKSVISRSISGATGTWYLLASCTRIYKYNFLVSTSPTRVVLALALARSLVPL